MLKLLSKYSIMGKVYAVFGVLLAVTFIASTLAVFLSVKSENSVMETADLHHKNNKIIELNVKLTEAQSLVSNFILSGDIDRVEAFKVLRGELDDFVPEVTTLLNSDAEHAEYGEHIQKIEKLYNSWIQEIVEPAFKYAQNPYTFDMARVLTVSERNDEIWQGVFENIHGLEALLARDLIAVREIEKSTMFLMKTSAIISAIVLLGFCVLSVLMVKKVIVSPLLSISSEFQELANFDLTRYVKVESEDEIGHMAEGFNRFVEKLRNLISAVGSASNQMAAAAEEMSSSMQNMVDMGKRQTDASSQILQAVQDSAQTAQEISDTSQSTQDNVSAISRSADNANECMGDLQRNSEEIVQVVSVINDIADQVNLLALNAAIEAARAGDAGRGFAVVADEVRKLAGHTANSTQQIEGAIQKLKGNVTKTGDALYSITDSIQNISGEVGMVTSSLTQQSAAIEEISSTVDMFTNQVEKLEQSIHEIEEVSGSIAREASELDSQIEVFKT